MIRDIICIMGLIMGLRRPQLKGHLTVGRRNAEFDESSVPAPEEPEFRVAPRSAFDDFEGGQALTLTPTPKPGRSRAPDFECAVLRASKL